VQIYLNLFAVSDGIRRKTKIYEQFQMETEKKSIFSTGFRRLRIEKRKSLFRRQENNFPLSAFSQILLSPFYCFSQVFAPYILGDYLLSL